MSAPNARDDADRKPRPTEADPHGRDHDEGLAGADKRTEVEQDERFANSREDGVVDKHNYLDDLGEAVASTLGSVIGQGDGVDAEIDAEARGGEKPRSTGQDESSARKEGE